MASNPTRRLRMTTDLLTCLATIPDRRHAEGKMYGQAGVILFSILAMVSGARSYRQIHTLMDRRLGLLNAAFPGAALRRAPAYTSVRSILQGLDEAELEQAFRRHAEGLAHTGAASPSKRSLTIAFRRNRRQDAPGQLRCLRGPKGGACAERFRRRSSDHPQGCSALSTWPAARALHRLLR